MSIKIGKKIKSYSVNRPEDKPAPNVTIVAPEVEDAMELPRAEVIQMHEKVERPDVLVGSTFKIKSPLFEHALYVTINDIILNEGSEYELRRPFEIFINSKNMDHFQWIVALTRIMSAVFRKGGDVTFLVEEMKAVFDPRGGYFKFGGVYMPSIVAEIGGVVEEHLKRIGLIVDPEMSHEQKKLIAEKRAAYDARTKKKLTETRGASVEAAPSTRRKPSTSTVELAESTATADVGEAVAEAAGIDESTLAFPPSASLCHKCHTKAVIIMDGCATCLSCGYSKCG